jgi:DNA-binding cell septation regulator SpoVG
MPTKTKPAGTSGGVRTITVSNWKPLKNQAMRGFLTLTLPSGLVIHNCHLLEAGGRRWVGLPARRFPTADGKVHYEPILEFTTRKAHRNFKHAALEVVEAYLKARGEW